MLMSGSSAVLPLRSAAWPGGRTSRRAPRARRGRSRAGAGCRAPSAGRTSSRVEWPASSACRAATAGQSTRSPSTPSSGSSLTRPGRSSSIGKASTSVGPSFSIHFSLSSAMVASSTSLMHSSASGCTRIWSITKRASRDSSCDVDVGPGLVEDLDAHGRLSPLRRGRAVAVPASVRGPRLGAGLVLVVRRDDVADQPVPDHVVRGEPVEGDVLDAGEDVLDDPQAAARARWAGRPG